MAVAGLVIVALFAGGIGMWGVLWRRYREIRAPDQDYNVPPLAFLALGFAMFMTYGMGMQAVVFIHESWARVLGLTLPAIACWMALRVARRPLPPPRAGAMQGSLRALILMWAAVPLIFLAAYVMTILEIGHTQEALDAIGQRKPGWQWIAAVAVFLAPIAEETIFRGLLYPAFRAAAGRTVAIIVPAVAFAAVHEVMVIPSMIVFGIAMALAREWTGATLPCIVAHMAFNGINTILKLATT